MSNDEFVFSEDNWQQHINDEFTLEIPIYAGSPYRNAYMLFTALDRIAESSGFGTVAEMLLALANNTVTIKPQEIGRAVPIPIGGFQIDYLDPEGVVFCFKCATQLDSTAAYAKLLSDGRIRAPICLSCLQGDY